MAWARGAFQDDTNPQHTVVLNAKALGNIASLEAIENLEYEQLVTELADEE